MALSTAAMLGFNLIQVLSGCSDSTHKYASRAWKDGPETSRDLGTHFSPTEDSQPSPACSNRSHQLSVFSVQSQASNLSSLTLEIEFNFEGYRKEG